jgi:hypothetical protein
MQINVSTKAVLGTLGTVLLGVASWFAVGHIDLGSRVKVLESDAQEDARQDEELREIRKTMQDMVVLFFHEHQAMPLHGDPMAEEMVEDAASEPVEEPFDFEGEGDADEAFSAVQMDVESALRGNGLEPARKASPPKRD